MKAQLSCGFHLKAIYWEIVDRALVWLLQLDNISNRLRDERRVELFLERGIFGFVKFSALVSGPDNRREDPFDK